MTIDRRAVKAPKSTARPSRIKKKSAKVNLAALLLDGPFE